MAPSTNISKSESNRILMGRGLAIVLRKSRGPIPKKKKNKKGPNNGTNCVPDMKCENISESNGPDIFSDWIRTNGDCFWNPTLVQSVKNLEYRGFVRPSTLLVTGTDYSLEVIRSAWGRRMLRPPNGYEIVILGDLDPVTMRLVSQTQFAPLPEALCKVVYDLTLEGTSASMQGIAKRLKTDFPEITLPSDGVLYQTLGTLIRERKLYHTGSGYCVVTPDSFRLLAVQPRQMLMTTDEALVRLHGAATRDDGHTAATQTQQLTAWSSAERILQPTKQVTGKLKRCHSLKLLRSRDKEKLSRSNSFKSTGTSPNQLENENIEANKKEKSPSVFTKWFRRGRTKSSKVTSLSTQFPPSNWEDPDYALFNSRATQTLENRSKFRSTSLNRPVSSRERHVSSTPATPRGQHSRQADIYHCRSSSLSRKTTPSPKRSSSPKTPVFQSPRYESPYSPYRHSQPSPLMAGDKYDDVIPSNPKVNPYQSTDILKIRPDPPPKKMDGWRRPTSMLSSFNHGLQTMDHTKHPPINVIPRFTYLPTKITSVPPPVVPSTKTTVVSSTIKSSETLTKTGSSTVGKEEFRLGTTVDVEISLKSKDPLKSGDHVGKGDPSENDLLKIATTLNQSIQSGGRTQTATVPKLTTTTNVTTSLSSSRQVKKDPGVVRSGRDSPGKETVCSRNSTLDVSKSEIFSGAAKDDHISKDDSGFSSCASTSRPMSISPC